MTFTRSVIGPFAIAAVCGAVASCSDDKTNVGIGSGSLDVTVTVDQTVHSTNNIPLPESFMHVPAPEDFSIVIIDSEGTAAKWEGTNPAGIPERLLPGNYTLRAVSGFIGAEGFDRPCFIGTSAVTIENGQTSTVKMTATLANALIDIEFGSSMSDVFKSFEATLHSFSGRYCGYTASDRGPLFLRPGDVSVFLSVATETDSVSFRILDIESVESANYYRVFIDAESGGDGVPVVYASSSSGIENSVRLSDDFMAASVPVVASEGFVNGEVLAINEGAVPSEAIAFSVSSSSLSHLYFTAIAPTLGSAFSSEFDLLDVTQIQADSLKQFGIVTEGLHKGVVENGKVDISQVLGILRYVPDAAPSTFSILAVDASGQISQPVTLSVDVKPVNIEFISVSPAVIGINKAQLTISSTSPDIRDNIILQSFDESVSKWRNMTIESIEPAGPDRWTVTFTVPDGLSEIAARMLFCGTERSTFTITRSAPEYSLEVDPFALHANIRITAKDSAIIGVIASSIQFYNISGNGKTFKADRLPMIERRASEGLITVLGLDASRSYRIYPSMLSSPALFPDDFASPVEFQTEDAAQLPNSDFEDVKFNSIKYTDMPSGGRYSQNTVEIYNRQNRTSINLMTPEKWANVNAKTFCSDASNHNTWYMAPSTYTVEDSYSGAYAVRLDCVGYDIDGMQIPDYLQMSMPFTDYSMNIPTGYSRAAGRLFLGTYSFDASDRSERYDEGLPFASRPAAVNGFYKFVATEANPRAYALARVKVIGDLEGAGIVIAEGEIHLPVALSYTAFTIPLTYNHFGIKAKSVHVMFAPSEAIGDLETENRSIIVIPDPATATSQGSSLWLDNISLSY